MRSMPLFIYGTLKSEKVLKKVLQNTVSKITHGKDVILHDYHCYKVENESYPAIFSLKGSKVVGVLLENVSDVDYEYLDEYEGLEYKREKVFVNTSSDGSGSNKRGSEIECFAYIFCEDEKQRLHGTWDYKHFSEDEFIAVEFSNR